MDNKGTSRTRFLWKPAWPAHLSFQLNQMGAVLVPATQATQYPLRTTRSLVQRVNYIALDCLLGQRRQRYNTLSPTTKSEEMLTFMVYSNIPCETVFLKHQPWSKQVH